MRGFIAYPTFATKLHDDGTEPPSVSCNVEGLTLEGDQRLAVINAKLAEVMAGRLEHLTPA